MDRRNFVQLSLTALQRRRLRATNAAPTQLKATDLCTIARLFENGNKRYIEQHRPFFATRDTIPDTERREIVDRIDASVSQKSGQQPDRWLFWSNGEQLAKNGDLHNSIFHRLSSFIEAEKGRIPVQQKEAIRTFMMNFARCGGPDASWMPIEISIANWAYSWNGLVKLCHKGTDEFIYKGIGQRDNTTTGHRFKMGMSRSRNPDQLPIDTNNWMIADKDSPIPKSQWTFKCQNAERVSEGVGLPRHRSMENRLRLYDVGQEMEVAEGAGYWIKDKFALDNDGMKEEVHLGTSEIRFRLVRYKLHKHTDHGTGDFFTIDAQRAELCLHRGHGGLFQVITRSSPIEAYEMTTPGESGFVFDVASSLN